VKFWSLIYFVLICNDLELASKCTAPVEDNASLDTLTSGQLLSENVVHQVAVLDSEALDRNPNPVLYITSKITSQSKCRISTFLSTDLQVQCAMEISNFPFLDSVKLVIFGSSTEGKALLLERESPEAWKQSSVAEL